MSNTTITDEDVVEMFETELFEVPVVQDEPTDQLIANYAQALQRQGAICKPTCVQRCGQ